MIRKLYGLVQGTIAEDNQDSPMHQEVLSAGHLYGMHFKVHPRVLLSALCRVVSCVCVCAFLPQSA